MIYHKIFEEFIKGQQNLNGIFILCFFLNKVYYRDTNMKNDEKHINSYLFQFKAHFQHFEPSKHYKKTY